MKIAPTKNYLRPHKTMRPKRPMCAQIKTTPFYFSQGQHKALLTDLYCYQFDFIAEIQTKEIDFSFRFKLHFIAEIQTKYSLQEIE